MNSHFLYNQVGRKNCESIELPNILFNVIVYQLTVIYFTKSRDLSFLSQYSFIYLCHLSSTLQNNQVSGFWRVKHKNLLADIDLPGHSRLPNIAVSFSHEAAKIYPWVLQFLSISIDWWIISSITGAKTFACCRSARSLDFFSGHLNYADNENVWIMIWFYLS